MRTLTSIEKDQLLHNQKQTEAEFKRKFPNKEMSPFLYYLPKDYMAFLMEDNNGIPPKINEAFPFIDDLLPIPDAQNQDKYMIVVNGEKFIYDLPFYERP